ncbi:MAG: hypothetical protein V9E94_08425 [Microthrixaceae bacterium]
MSVDDGVAVVLLSGRRADGFGGWRSRAGHDDRHLHTCLAVTRDRAPRKAVRLHHPEIDLLALTRIEHLGARLAVELEVVRHRPVVLDLEYQAVARRDLDRVGSDGELHQHHFDGRRAASSRTATASAVDLTPEHCETERDGGYQKRNRGEPSHHGHHQEVASVHP